MNTPSHFTHFCHTADAVAATPSRLAKAAALATYLPILPDADLERAARYLSGQAFPQRDQRTTNVGGAALVTAILSVSGADDAQFRQRLVTLGDPGDAALESFAASAQSHLAPTLTLADIEAALHTLAATSGSKAKVTLVTALLARATPLEAKYLVKLLAGDLRIGLKESAVEDALARLADAELAQVQWANMLEGDIGQTALLARHGKLGDARMRLFHPLKFMLATPAADNADVARQMPSPFVVEDKFDGIRAQAHIAPTPGGARVALFTRTLDDITNSYPDLLEALAGLLAAPTGFILDGEIVPVRGDRILPFQELQKRLGRKTPTPEILSSVPVAFIAYDLLYADGDVLLNAPLRARRARLETLPFDGRHARLAPSLLFSNITTLDEEFTQARARGNEGLMVKDPASPYKPGRRGRDWLKIKKALATLDVVVTSVEVGNGRRAKFLSDYTFAVRASDTDPTLLNVGKAYSGLTDAEIQTLSEWFEAHTTQQFAHGKVRVVEPSVVLEVTFDRVQPSARHKGGFALRFPRILRIRDDKPANEIDTLDTVRRLAETQTLESPAHD